MNIIQNRKKILLPPFKKLLSRTITHRLSRQLDKTKYEVVQEGFLDIHNLNIQAPDVVIYSKNNPFQPLVVIEICTTEELTQQILSAKKMITDYSLIEFLIYNLDSDNWYRLNDGDPSVIKSSFSKLFLLDLKDTVRIFPIHHSN